MPFANSLGPGGSVQIVQPGQPAPASKPQPAAPPPAPPPPNQVPYATSTPGFNGNGNSPQYGTQSPSMWGTGQYTAPLYAISDQAITGAPTQGAGQDYGLEGGAGSVWSNLANEIARSQGPGPMQMVRAPAGSAASYGAATGNAAMAGPTALSRAGNTIGQQANLAAILNAQAMGQGAPSAADLQLQAGSQANQAALLSALGSQRGSTNPALAARAAMDQSAAAQANLNQQMGIQRAQETQAAQQMEGNVLQSQGAQAAGLNATQAGYQQQTALQNAEMQNAMLSGNLNAINAANAGNAQLSQAQELANLGYSQQSALANQNAQLGNAQFGAQQLNAALGAQTGIAQSQQAAALADADLEVKQMIAANEVNEQGFQAAANANSNLTGTIFNAAAGLGATALQAGLAGGSSAGAGGGAYSTAPSGATGGISLDQNGTPNVTWGGTLPTGPGSTWAMSDKHAKRDIEPADEGVWSRLQDDRPVALPEVRGLPRARLPAWALSDENLKTGIEGGNPMMRSFLNAYKKATAPKDNIDVTSGSNFRNPMYAKAQSSGGGGGILGGFGTLVGGALGTLVAPGVGTAVGAGLGGTAGRLADSQMGGGSGGGTYMTSPGSGVTENADSDYPTLQTDALSDENEKEAITSGNRGMSQFLAQANSQQNAEARNGSESNSFMQTGTPPTSEMDTQLPHQGFGGMYAPSQSFPGPGMPSQPFAGPSNPSQGFPGPGMPSQPFGGPSYGPQYGLASPGGVANYGGYEGAQMIQTGGFGPNPNVLSPQSQQALVAPHAASMPSAANSMASYSPQAQQNYINGLARNLGFAQPPPAPQVAMPGTVRPLTFAMSDERSKRDVAPTNRNIQDFLDKVKAYNYRYKAEATERNPSLAPPGEHTGVLAQDLQRSKLGKSFVHDGPDGLTVDYGSMGGVPGQAGGVLLASSAYLNDRVNGLQDQISDLARRAPDTKRRKRSGSNDRVSYAAANDDSRRYGKRKEAR